MADSKPLLSSCLRRTRWLPGALAAVLLGACGDAPPEQAEPQVATESLPTFVLGEVVDQALAEAQQLPTAEPFDPALLEELEGLTVLVSSTPSLRRSARDDVLRWGTGVWEALARLALDETRADVERAAAVDLFVLEQPLACEALFSLVSDGEPPWVRARAAWRLAEEGPDYLVPDLLRRLRYETDHEVVVWLAVALARQDNLAGVDVLMAIAADGNSTGNTAASMELGKLCLRHGVETGLDLRKAWQLPAEERGFPTAPRSARFQQQVWKWISRFEEFQLRGVDDARFVLERLDAESAKILGEALHDSDVYTRVHSAQCLQRMGRRGVVAGPELLLALGEPQLAPKAALALGHVGYAAAQESLVGCLEETHPLALRLAAARALGHMHGLDAEEARSILEPWLGGDSLELAQAAGESLLRRDPSSRAVALRVASHLQDSRLDPGSSERALRHWLTETQGSEFVERWDAFGGPAGRPETSEEIARRLEGRRGLINEIAGL